MKKFEVGNIGGLSKEFYLDELDLNSILVPAAESSKKTSTSCLPWEKDNKTTTNLYLQSYKQKYKWKHLFYGDTTVSEGEYFSQTQHNIAIREVPVVTMRERMLAGCIKVLFFSVRGKVLDKVILEKKCFDGSFIIRGNQIMLLDKTTFWHYPNLRITKESEEKVVVVQLVQSGNKTRCKKTQHFIKNQTSSLGNGEQQRPSSEPQIVDEANWASDEDCKALKGESGPLPWSSVENSGKAEYTFGINMKTEHTIGIRFWSYLKPFCHWKLKVHLGGIPVGPAAAIFCNDFTNIVVTRSAFYFGNVIAIRESNTNLSEISMLYNNRNGECQKYHYELNVDTQDTQSPKLKSITQIHELDENTDCKDFLEGKLPGKQMSNDELDSAIRQLKEDQIRLRPLFTAHLWNRAAEKAYVPKTILATISNNNGLSILIIENQLGKIYYVLVAKGVILDVAARPYIQVNHDPRGQVKGPFTSFIVTENSISCSYLSLEKDKTDVFSVLSGWDEEYCTRKRYALLEKDGRLQRQKLFPVEIGVDDEKCSSIWDEDLDDGLNRDISDMGGFNMGEWADY